MTCAKCGMSIDANAGERQESVRGRVKEKPEIEIDPSMPATPSKFPLGLAIAIAVLVIGGVVFVAYQMRARSGAYELTTEQRDNLRLVEKKQRAFAELYASSRVVDAPSCQQLLELVLKPCLPTVQPDKLDLEEAYLGVIVAEQGGTCVAAIKSLSESRVASKCDR